MRRIKGAPMSQSEMFGEKPSKPVITRAWVVKSVTLYVLWLAVVWYLGWRYLGSGMTH
jgi:hypothetical protein